ncbi:virulence protein RhuM/Fic/DOC family protein [Marinilabilia salmonicolor]|jgi:prophage maintenance system killer protein|uniref:Fic/DOC family protein n=1 Tax=Marinilabilia salmonicolor TaxID=989 RepID=A0A2T0XTH4_9BACT|nr:virulence protein RhuM/Fic/DOC family protein [Marinilabilia salmonicolor]PRZ02249.1 Fic/DOC family protein [Marinilabilia salmonicolor]RCW36203.1 Fic/DOC family protein [Marinilabilia salmonicolor]
MKDTEIEIFQSEDGVTEVQVKFEKETVWLSQKQMAHLFDKNTDTIGLHLRNIYKSGELDTESTTEESSVVQQEGKRRVKRKLNLYNLDAIISVGYRVNSKRGIQFRKWATQKLKEYLIKGYAINEQRLAQKNEQLKELQKTVRILDKGLNFKTLSNNESIGLLKIITDYSYALDVLDQYDYQKLEINNTSEKELFHLTYKDAIKQIRIVKDTYGNSDLFGHEKDESFKSSIATIYQTFQGIELYPSIEEKAANLLYFITKNHSFTDGNKRIAAFLFLYFLEKNGLLFNEFGNKRIADNTLVALTLMIAVSKPEEKETMIKVIVNLINKNN